LISEAYHELKSHFLFQITPINPNMLGLSIFSLLSVSSAVACGKPYGFASSFMPGNPSTGLAHRFASTLKKLTLTKSFSLN
ncbi:MAG: hypothetical protein RM049_38430, partial [Nostoc sp. DedQUE04]|uniref:hypothetical protein n=1 Tax=Nostoc sp. DedQUE04 TaxID=3075390 RepID=UPI002AD42D56